MNNPFKLTDKTILVTGASSGIGREICVQISRMGGRVVATGRNEERLKETLSMLSGVGHEAVRADLIHPSEMDALIAQTLPLNGLVHSAGYFKLLPLKFVSEKELNSIFAVNYQAAILLTQRILIKRLLQPGASIIFIASIAAQIGSKANTMYAGTKGALTSSARVMAVELAPQKIRVNCISPGMVKTPIAEQTTDLVSKELVEKDELRYPLGYGESADVAYATVYLLSDASKWMTGANLTLDGGYTCQ